MTNKQISLASLKRLPQYLRIIENHSDMEYISSTFIANELGLNPIQVRKDLALVSKSDGKPGNGFEVKKIKEELENFLGMNNVNDAIIVGAGKLGQALLNYQGFNGNLNILMAFDNDDKICNGKNIFNVSKIKKIIKKENVKIGIITVPKEAAQDVCDIMTSAGVKAIWNFAPVHLSVPDDVVVKNEDLSASILILLNEFHENKRHLS